MADDGVPERVRIWEGFHPTAIVTQERVGAVRQNLGIVGRLGEAMERVRWEGVSHCFVADDCRPFAPPRERLAAKSSRIMAATTRFGCGRRALIGRLRRIFIGDGSVAHARAHSCGAFSGEAGAYRRGSDRRLRSLC